MVEDSGPPLSGQPRAAVLHGLNRGFEPFFGMNEKDLRVNYEDGLLTVSGERRAELREDDRHYHRIERSYGSFVRSFALPYRNGIPEIEILKLEESKPRQIQVNVG